MEMGVGFDEGGNLAQQLSALTLSRAGNHEFENGSDSNNIIGSNDGLFQVMKAVEAAEATIKQQVDENNRLRSELQKKIQELEKYKADDTKAGGYNRFEDLDGHAHAPQMMNREVSPLASRTVGVRSIGSSAVYDASRVVLQKDLMQDGMNSMPQAYVESQLEGRKMNGSLKMLAGGGVAMDNEGMHHFSPVSTGSLSPSRYQLEGEYYQKLNLSAHGLVPVAKVKTPSSPLKQDAVASREHEQEISQLRKHLAEYSIKEAQIRNEKFALEKRIAYMRLAFDQQQQDLVDAASKALSYRQDIIEENIRLTYALQDAQEERSTFISSLMPLLAEYSLQPPVADAQSIVSNLKVLFRHMQEKLIIIEEKLKKSQYQLATWHSDTDPSTFVHSPFQSIQDKNGLELVPQRAYSDGQIPIVADRQETGDLDTSGNHRRLGGGLEQTLQRDDLGRHSAPSSRNIKSLGIPAQLLVDGGNLQPTRRNEEFSSKQVTFSDPVSSSDMDDPDIEGRHNEGEPIVNWASQNSSYAMTVEDPTSSYSPYLPPVLEEPSSSFSEAADDDPLPAVESLQISGEAFPGRELQASGFSVNGTTSCNFEWVRHMEDGSVNYIEGAKQPTYLVTADDIDTYLAIEVQPLDMRKRKGELVKVFANDQRKIACDPEMQDHIKKTLSIGHASYRLSLSTGYIDIWEPATLNIKREGYSIKGSGPSGVAVTEKFSPSTTVTIPCGNPVEFAIIDAAGIERRLRTEYNAVDISCSRDTIVLVMRYFMKRAGEKKKAKKKNLFFNK